MYGFLGICLALAALLAINAILSLLVTSGWRIFTSLSKNWSAMMRARSIFILRTLPATVALLAMIVFLIPSYLAFEPRQTRETISVKLGLLAFFSAIGIASALWRGIAAWLATKNLTDDWLANSEIIYLENLPLPAYRIRHQFPVVAVIGVWRPKLFVASQIFDSLNAEELSAVIAHETAHIAAGDNLKHWLMRICRDILMIAPSTTRALDKNWAEAVELAADEQAARGGNVAALDLAQALIKIARLVPKGFKPMMPAGAFLIGDDIQNGDALTVRVRRLAQLAETNFNMEKDRRERLSGGFVWICFGLLFFAATTLAATNSDVLGATHAVIERIVTF